MKALITGGAGFIGSHLAEALCRKGAKVVIVDDLSSGSLDNLQWRKSGDEVELIQADLFDEKLMTRVLQGCDWVFHEAALPSVPRSVAEPLRTHHQNLNLTLQLLVQARDARVKRFLFASSSSVYGNSTISPKHEGLPPQPVSPYALQKYAAERYGQIFHQLYGLETVGLRYFNVFGPRQSFNTPFSGVIALFCPALLANCPPTIFGDGLQSRDFTYVDNVVSANLLAAEAPAEKAAGRVFNVAAGQNITLRQLVDELNRLTGRNFTPKYEPPRPGDVRHSLADLTAISEAIGYRVLVKWQEGLAKTLEYYRMVGSA